MKGVFFDYIDYFNIASICGEEEGGEVYAVLFFSPRGLSAFVSGKAVPWIGVRGWQGFEG